MLLGKSVHRFQVAGPYRLNSLIYDSPAVDHIGEVRFPTGAEKIAQHGSQGQLFGGLLKEHIGRVGAHPIRSMGGYGFIGLFCEQSVRFGVEKDSGSDLPISRLRADAFYAAAFAVVGVEPFRLH
jgi:hypothetical protein